MADRRYQLRFLPLFEDDLDKIVDYMVTRLENPCAASRFIDAVEQSVLERTACAEAFEQYHSSKERQYPYYRIYVQQYIIFYVVIDDVMEVRRIIHNRRDIKEHI